LAACPQSTPLAPAALDAMSWLANPTPRMDPMSVWELEAGKPRNHVPRFQMIAPMSSANTIAKPALDPTLRMSSTGRSATMAYATAPLDASTPRKLNKPDHRTAS
jgi:hypothetical protein